MIKVVKNCNETILFVGVDSTKKKEYSGFANEAKNIYSLRIFSVFTGINFPPFVYTLFASVVVWLRIGIVWCANVTLPIRW